jgi:hypothetical protein
VFERLPGVGRGELVIMIKIDDFIYANDNNDDNTNMTMMTMLPLLQTRRTMRTNTLKNITINLYIGGKDNNDQQ